MQTTIHKIDKLQGLTISTGNYTQYLIRENNLFLSLCMYIHINIIEGFPDSSVGKESTCNTENPGLIPGSGRCTGEALGYSFQCSWVSLVAQLVKNSPAMQKNPVPFLGQEDALEKA